MTPILELQDLHTCFDSRDGKVEAVCRVDLTIGRGEILGLVGETGCGKSVLGQSILRLLPANTQITGKILFEGTDLLQQGKKYMQNVRRTRIAYINQNPSEALNPVLKAGTQILEGVKVSRGLKGAAGREFARRNLRSLSFADPDRIMEQYPVELSGGMKQRVLAAMAMSGEPVLLIADEPTKGLDALIRGQVIETLRQFITVTGCSALIITHDLKFAGAICNRLAVMYAGEIVETGPAEKVLTDPGHPYMQGLLYAMPDRGMKILEGSACSLIDLPVGCRFAERCVRCKDRCRKYHPDMKPLADDREVRCWEVASGQ